MPASFHHIVALLFVYYGLLVPNGVGAFQPSRLSRQPFLHHGRSAYMPSTTPLFYRDRDYQEEVITDHRPMTTTSAEQPMMTPDTSKINWAMIQRLCLSQLTILTLFTVGMMTWQFWNGSTIDLLSAWNWTPDASSVLDLTPLQLVQGIVAALPMITWSHLLEHSDRRDAHHVNFATTNMVVTLFGRRRRHSNVHGTSTLQVLLSSLLLTLVTSISEEVVFRGYLPVLLVSLTHSAPLALVGQAMLFGAGHAHAKSKPGENRVVVGLQTLNGLWYGLVYLYGGIVPCILSHMLYDLHVFVETYHQTNNQIDWAEQSHPLYEKDRQGIRELQQEAGKALTHETLSFCRRFFYAFDSEQKESLSKADVQRAVAYAFLQDKVAPTERQVEQMFYSMASGDRLDLPEFLRLLFTLRSRVYARQTEKEQQPVAT